MIYSLGSSGGLLWPSCLLNYCVSNILDCSFVDFIIGHMFKQKHELVMVSDCRVWQAEHATCSADPWGTPTLAWIYVWALQVTSRQVVTHMRMRSCRLEEESSTV